MSLRDQLLKAGVATKKQHQLARTKKKQKTRNKKESTQSDLNNDNIQKARETQKARDKTLNQQIEAERAKKALLAQIKQLVTSNAIEHEKGDTPYRFAHHNKIKTLYLSENQAEKIIRGNIAIAAFDEDEYYFIPWPVAEKLSKKNEDIVLVNNRKAEDKSVSEEDDPYADYEIPDDLMW